MYEKVRLINVFLILQINFLSAFVLNFPYEGAKSSTYCMGSPGSHSPAYRPRYLSILRIKIAMFPLEASTTSARDSLHFPTNGQHSISPADSVPLYQEHFLCTNPQEKKTEDLIFQD